MGNSIACIYTINSNTKKNRIRKTICGIERVRKFFRALFAMQKLNILVYRLNKLGNANM